MPIVRSSLPLLLAGAALAACGGDPPPADPDASAPRYTWYQDVAPVLARHCMGCHQPGGIGPFSLTEYALAKEYASIALFAVEHGIMPPWDAEDGDDCAPRFGWQRDPRLSADQIAMLRAWIEDGMPEGEPAAVPPPPDTSLAGVTHSLAPSTGHVTAGDHDEFICYVLDPGLTQWRFLTGIQLRPGNEKVVHHTVTWTVPPGEALSSLVAQRGVGQPYPCPGGATGLPGAYLLHVWTPGNEPLELPAGVAAPIQPGSALVIQFHYHPGGVVNDPDVSTVDLRLSAAIPDKLYAIGAVGNAFQAPELLPGPNDPGGTPVFYIPPGVADHREHMRFVIETEPGQRFPIYAAYPHMHYIGIGLSVTIHRPAPPPGEPADECLVNVNRWDFDWQRSYVYDAPIDRLPTVGDGDVVEIRCSYDNTMDNPFVQRALAERGLTAPIPVFLGEESLDEMCLNIFPVLFDVPQNLTAGAPAPPPLRLVPRPPFAADSR